MSPADGRDPPEPPPSKREFVTLFAGDHPPLLLQQIPDLEHGFHTPAPLGES
jgi:hypothetical protein